MTCLPTTSPSAGRWLYLVMGLLVLGPADGQAQSRPATRLGVSAGMNAAYVLIEANTDMLWRYNAGVAVEQRFSPSFGLSAQLLYSRQGGRVFSGRFGTAIYNFDYLTLPLTVRYRPREAPRTFVEVGGQLGYLLLAQDYVVSATTPRARSRFRNVHQLDHGLTGGIGYRLGQHWVVNARYYHGLRSITADHIAPDPQTGVPTFYRVQTWYNRVWMLNTTYYF